MLPFLLAKASTTVESPINQYLITAIGALVAALGALFWQVLSALKVAKDSKNEVILTQKSAHEKETATLREVLPLHTSTVELVQGVLKHLETTEISISLLTTLTNTFVQTTNNKHENIEEKQKEILSAIKRIERRQRDILLAQGPTSSLIGDDDD